MAASKADASDPIAAEAAQQALDDGGAAADATIAGFLAAAGAREGVLLAPVIALVGGIGAGTRLIDGRAAQPGAGAKRPRGFLAGDPIPDVARAAVPRSLDALALLQHYGARQTPRTLARAGMAHAKDAGATRRRGLLEIFGRRGATALRSGEPLRHLVSAAGAPAGGLLTETDLVEARPGDDPAVFQAHGALAIAAPWWPSPPAGRRAQVVVAADLHGGVAALAYVPDDEGVLVPELEVRLPRDAEPVRRSVPRVSPGTPCPATAPIALMRRSAEAWFAALGIAGGPLDLSGADPDAPLASLLGALSPSRPALAVSTQRRKTLATRVD